MQQENEWPAETQALKLPTLKEKVWLAGWLELSEAEQVDIVVTKKKKLMEKIMPIGFVSLDQFHAEMLQPGESESLALELKKLLGQAMGAKEPLTEDTMIQWETINLAPVSYSCGQQQNPSWNAQYVKDMVGKGCNC